MHHQENNGSYLFIIKIPYLRDFFNYAFDKDDFWEYNIQLTQNEPIQYFKKLKNLSFDG